MSFNREEQAQALSNNNLLTIFRIAIFGRLVVALSFFLFVPTVFEAQGLSRLLGILDALGLSIYLTATPLQNWLKQRYLQIALLWATVVPLIITTYTIYLSFVKPLSPMLPLSIESIENFVVVSNLGQTLPTLLIPLLVISWRDTQRKVAWFCIGTNLLDISLIAVFVPLGQTGYLLALTLIGFRLIIMGMVGIIVNQLVQTQRIQSQALHDANTRLRDANTRLRDYATTREYLITSQERNRLAREMHDTLAHSLAAVTVQLEAVRVIWDAQPDRAKQLVDESAQTVRSGLQETRRALQALRAETLESLGFVESIHELAKTTQARHGFNVTVDATGNFAWLTNEQEHVLYRIVQEALHNSAKHASPQHLNMIIQGSDNTLSLIVVDDGVGFDSTMVHTDGHFGVQGMRERADIIDAKLDITSQIGQGTTIRVNLERTPDAHNHM